MEFSIAELSFATQLTLLSSVDALVFPLLPKQIHIFEGFFVFVSVIEIFYTDSTSKTFVQMRETIDKLLFLLCRCSHESSLICG